MTVMLILALTLNGVLCLAVVILSLFVTVPMKGIDTLLVAGLGWLCLATAYAIGRAK